MEISGVIRFSLIDYPDEISCVLFTQGCNLRCPYCHNPELLELKKGEISQEEIMRFLKERIKKISSVVITGGEPTIQKGLEDFISKLKMLGFLVKLDTNGTNPYTIDKLVNKNLLDYIAMDIKFPLDKYRLVGLNDTKVILDSVKIIINSKIPHEFRTTYVKELLEIKDFGEIGKILEGAEKFVLQKFHKSRKIFKDIFKEQNLTEEEINTIKSIINKYVKIMEVRK